MGLKKENNKDTFIILRVSSESKRELVELAGGVRKLSKYIRKLLGIE